MSTTTHIEIPAGGAKIVPGEPTPDNPIIPFIEGDGIGVDITPVMIVSSMPPSRRPTAAERKVALDGDLRRREGERACTARTSGCRRRRSRPCREYSVSIKGPLTTPVGGGIRSLNVALRQELDLYRLPAAGAVFRRRALAR